MYSKANSELQCVGHISFGLVIQLCSVCNKAQTNSNLFKNCFNYNNHERMITLHFFIIGFSLSLIALEDVMSRVGE